MDEVTVIHSVVTKATGSMAMGRLESMVESSITRDAGGTMLEVGTKQLVSHHTAAFLFEVSVFPACSPPTPGV
jgi:hypothetical protein